MAANLDPNNNVDSQGNPLTSNTTTPASGVGSGPTSGGAQQGSGAHMGGVSSGGVQNIQAPSGPAPIANQSGQFTNLQNYLNANQGAGQQIAGVIGQSGQNQANAIGTAAGNAQGVIGGQIAAENANIGQASGWANTIDQSNAPVMNTAFDETPNSTAPTPAQLGGAAGLLNTLNSTGQLGDFQSILAGQNNSATLQGQATQALNPIQNQVNNLNTFANQANSETGRFGLLQQTLGRAGYNQGEQGIDQFLLQTSPGNILGNLQTGLTNTAVGAGNTLANTQGNLSAGINALNPASAAAAAQLSGAIGTTAQPGTTSGSFVGTGTGQLGQLQQNLIGNQNQLNTQATTDLTNLQQALAAGQINSQQFADINTALGGTLNAGSYINQAELTGLGGGIGNPFTAQQYNLNQAATAPQYAQYQALQQLAGGATGNNTIAGFTGAAAVPTNDIAINTAALSPQVADEAGAGGQAFTQNEALLNQLNQYGAQQAATTAADVASGQGNAAYLSAVQQNKYAADIGQVNANIAAATGNTGTGVGAQTSIASMMGGPTSNAYQQLLNSNPGTSTAQLSLPALNAMLTQLLGANAVNQTPPSQGTIWNPSPIPIIGGGGF